MIAIACPYCQQAQNVIKFGTTSSGTARAKCNDCQKTFAINPKSRAITSEKEAAIERHLNERTSIRSICRTLKVSPNTVYKVYATLKKSRGAAGL